MENKEDKGNKKEKERNKKRRRRTSPFSTFVGECLTSHLHSYTKRGSKGEKRERFKFCFF